MLEFFVHSPKHLPSHETVNFLMTQELIISNLKRNIPKKMGFTAFQIKSIILLTLALQCLTFKVLKAETSTCKAADSYLTLGDYFHQLKISANPKNTHYFTVGFITSGICADTPQLYLTSDDAQVVPLKLDPFLQDDYNYTSGSDLDALWPDTKLGDVYSRISSHFKIKRDHLESKYTHWQIILENKVQDARYKIPDYTKYIQPENSRKSIFLMT
jgi:hypothetical protein